jgi:DNA-binding transcriptional LysR family regulator
MRYTQQHYRDDHQESDTAGQSEPPRTGVSETCRTTDQRAAGAAADIRPRIAFESSDLVTVAGLVSAGLGVAILPGEDPPSTGPLSGPVTVPLTDAGAARAVGLIWPVAATPSTRCAVSVTSPRIGRGDVVESSEEPGRSAAYSLGGVGGAR